MASAAPPVSLRSSSGSSASSLSSTFSDVTCATDVSFSSSPPGAKTNAFFASPFNTRPPSPIHAQHHQPPAQPPPRSLTADFFATPVRAPSPPASTSTPTSPHKHTDHSQIHASRIFPSRYTSTAESARSPEFSLLNLDEPAPHAYHPPPASYHAYTHTRTPSDSSEDSITLASPTSSIFGRPRLPTPPPPPTPAHDHHRHTLHREDTIVPLKSRSANDEAALEPRDDLTPRPAPREPAMLQFERSLLLARQAEAQADAQMRLHPPSDPHGNAYTDEEDEEEEELKEGSIISLPPTSAIASFPYGGAASSPPVRTAPLPISPLALAFTLGPDPSTPHDRETPTPTPVSDASEPLESGQRSPDPPAATVSSSHLHPQSGSHAPVRPSSLPSPLPLPSPSIPRSPSALARSLSTSSSSSSVSAQHVYAYASSPTSSLPPHAQTPTPAPQLRLLRPLGHGAFSTVWLAEDLSRVPLTLVSRKSVRDLRRRASGRERDAAEKERDALRENGREKEKDRTRRAKDRETTRTPEPVRISHHELDQRAAALDDTPRPPAARPPASILGLAAPVPSAAEPNKSSRLREGLRSMLAFSRGAGAALMNTTANADAGVNAESTHHAEHAEAPQADVDMDDDTDTESLPISPLSRTSSIRSVESAASVSLSRASSVSVRLVSDSPAEAHTNAALLRDASLRKFRARVRGTRPALRLASGRVYLDERDGEMGVRIQRGRRGEGVAGQSREGDSEEGDTEGEGSMLRASLTRKPSGIYAATGAGGMKAVGRLVAVKMTARRVPRTTVAGASAVNGVMSSRREKEKERIRLLERQRRREEEERTRVRFVREVEVLKHISHPNITPLIAHLSTATHHILVLPYLPGGDLLGLVNNDVAWGKLSESVLRRIWIELCKAVGWMHGVGLVHRDIKLENILLTTSIFSALDPAAPSPTLAALPVPPAPFIKLTDFGLSRFVELDANGDAELLSTRCGSEAYAAPELVTGGGMYDARKTDAWACGVVLYALVGRVLPFGEGAGPVGEQAHSQKIGGERGGEQRRGATPAERRHWLMRIARGEWTWPGAEGEEQQQVTAQDSDQAASNEELVGARLVQSRGARRIVDRLLVRDTRKRARIADLWDDVWMGGAGEEGIWWRSRERENGKADVEMLNLHSGDEARVNPQTWDGDAPEFWKDAVDVGFYDAPTGPDGLSEKGAVRHEGSDEGAVEEVVVVVGEEGEEELEEEEEEEDGCLFDQEGIDSITRQEII